MILTWSDSLAALDVEQADLLVGFAAGKDLGTLAKMAHRDADDVAKILGDALQYLGKTLYFQGKRADYERRERRRDA